jgi:hypothetical protein
MNISYACEQCVFCQYFTNVRLHRTDWLMVDHHYLLPEVGPRHPHLRSLRGQCQSEGPGGAGGGTTTPVDADDQSTAEHDAVSRAWMHRDIRELCASSRAP